MTAQAHTGSGGGLMILCAMGVGVALLLTVAGQVAIPLDAQPIPPQPTVPMPAPAIVYYSGLGTVFLADTLELPTGAVQTGTHAEERHTKEEAEEVRAFMKAYIIANPIFGNQPPCDDGRYRFVAEMAPGVWGLWVLEKIGDMLYNEKTAFKIYDKNYANSITDNCGKKNKAWWGHVYAVTD